jgi:preprotein translocase subunit SecA
VGTTSIENSELIAELLEKEKLPHQVLNAKQHAREADIVAQAGRPKMITIATNMAGRGTDIVLGGNISKIIEAIEADESLDDAQKQQQIAAVNAQWAKDHEQVTALGGLRIIATERHESRRIDNQLRGRSGRQGDPGSSRFYLSLDDALMRIFAGERVKAIMDKLKMPEGEAIEAGMVTRSIESAQRKVEARNFDIRKQLLEYDDVSNDQRKVIYAQRNELLETQDISDTTHAMREDVISQTFGMYIPRQSMEEQWDVPGLEKALQAELQLQLPLTQWLEEDSKLGEEGLLKRVLEAAHSQYQAKQEQVGTEVLHHFERAVMLQSMDTHWREHLAALDHLRQGIHLRGYAQKNPKQEYKREAFELFSALLERIKSEVTQITMTVQVKSEEDVAAVEEQLPAPENLQYQHAEYNEAPGHENGDTDEGEEKHEPFVRANDKVGRNDPCPCGSGKKYKQCHGKLS